MAIVNFDTDNKLHQDILDEFITHLKTNTGFEVDFEAKYNGWIDSAGTILRAIAAEEFDEETCPLDEDTGCFAALINKEPDNFGLIVALDCGEHEFDKKDCSTFYMKAVGSILIEDNNHIIWDIEPSLFDYSNSKEFRKLCKR